MDDGTSLIQGTLFSPDGPSSGAEDRLWGFSHSRSSAPSAGLPMPPLPPVGPGHLRLLSLDVPGPVSLTFPPTPARTPSPAPPPPPLLLGSAVQNSRLEEVLGKMAKGQKYPGFVCCGQKNISCLCLCLALRFNNKY